jgi:diguanylate cyclase (GGDEF)-like protein
MSLIDPVTGISNRRHFEETFEIEWRRALRNNGFVTVAMIDVDSFKLFNDKFGHIAGDDCLRQVALCLAGTAKRGGDLVARYGGEEFVVISTSIVPEQARSFGEMFRVAIEEQLKVTISIGIVTRKTKEVNCKGDLIKLADQALYKAKCNGKNCLVVYDEFGQTAWDNNRQLFMTEECGVLLMEIRTRIKQLSDYIKNGDRESSQYAMLSIVALSHRIQQIASNTNNQRGYEQANTLFQALTHLSSSLNKVWNLPENEQAILWNELIPMLKNISKRLETPESFH